MRTLLLLSNRPAIALLPLLSRNGHFSLSLSLSLPFRKPTPKTTPKTTPNGHPVDNDASRYLSSFPAVLRSKRLQNQASFPFSLSKHLPVFSAISSHRNQAFLPGGQPLIRHFFPSEPNSTTRRSTDLKERPKYSRRTLGYWTN